MGENKKKSLFELLAEGDFQKEWPLESSHNPELDELSYRYQYKLGFPEAVQFVKAGKNALQRALERAETIDKIVNFYIREYTRRLFS